MLTPFTAGKQIDWPAFDALVDWYVAGGSEGLFASCLSSELFALAPEERLELAGRAVARAGGRVPVIAAGAFGDTPQAIAEAAGRLAGKGIVAVVFLTNQFAAADESDEVWLRNAEVVLAKLDPSIPLGLYECPVPYKRVLSAAMVSWASGTGRFHFIKDTCCDLSLIKAKIGALAGSSLKFYNANTATLLASLQAGGHGFSGVGTNALPHLYAWLCRNFKTQPVLAAELQAFLDESSRHVDLKYPGSVKSYLQLQGLPMDTVCRVPCEALDQGEREGLSAFHLLVTQWEARLGLQTPFSVCLGAAAV